MTTHDRFETLGDYLNFENVKDKLSDRPDLHAFILLDRKFPEPGRDIVTAAEHDQFYLGIDDEQLEQLTDDEITDLTRCGVMHDKDCGLFMFT